MNTLESPDNSHPESQELSWSSRQALAILAVDNIRPSEEAIALMRAIDAGKITHEQAIQSLLEKARRYAQESK